MMRVLHVIDHLGLGGAQAVLCDLARGLRAAGVECGVAAIHCAGIFARRLEEEGVPVRVLAGSKWNPVFLIRFLRLVERTRPDILHFHLEASNWLLKPLAALFSRARRVAHDHASADLRFRGFAALAPDALAHLFSHRVAAVSPAVARLLAGCEGVPESRIALIPNGVDTVRFHPPAPAERGRARERLGLPAGAFVAGALGRLAPEKNFTGLVAVAELCPQVEFIIGGEGPCRGEIQAALDAARPGTRLHLVGRVDDRESFFHALDVFLLPSFYEGLPMVLLEAMASGLPMIASPLPDIRQALGEAGVYAPADSPGAWARELEALRASPRTRELLGVAARDRCLEVHGLGQAVRKLVGLYGSLLLEAGLG